MAYPKELRGSNITADIKILIREIGSRLLSGITDVHAQLRDQLAGAGIEVVTLTGVGLYADFAVASDVQPVEPPEMIGGEVSIEVEGLDAPAGSLIAVKEGKIAFVEIYTYGNVAWPDHPRVVSYGEPAPLLIPERAS